MSCNSAILVVNENTAQIPINGLVPLGSVVRRFGKNCLLSGNGVVCDGQGYYQVDAVVTLIPSAVGTVNLTLLSDGVALVGSTVSETVAAANDSATLAISYMVRNRCCEDGQTLTLQVGGVAASASAVMFRVVKA